MTFRFAPLEVKTGRVIRKGQRGAYRNEDGSHGNHAESGTSSLIQPLIGPGNLKPLFSLVKFAPRNTVIIHRLLDRRLRENPRRLGLSAQLNSRESNRVEIPGRKFVKFWIVPIARKRASTLFQVVGSFREPSRSAMRVNIELSRGDSSPPAHHPLNCLQFPWFSTITLTGGSEVDWIRDYSVNSNNRNGTEILLDFAWGFA